MVKKCCLPLKGGGETKIPKEQSQNQYTWLTDPKNKGVLMIEHFEAYRGTIVFFSILFISLLATSIRKFCLKHYALAFSPKFAQFMDSKLMFLGVVHHELSHALFVVLTGAKLVKVKLFQLNTSDGRLGYVAYGTKGPFWVTGFQKGLISIAPVIMGCVTLLFIFHLVSTAYHFTNWEFYVLIIFALHVTNHTAMSKEDWKLSLPALPLVYFFVVGIVRILDIELQVILDYLKLVTILLVSTTIPPFVSFLIFGKNKKYTVKVKN